MKLLFHIHKWQAWSQIVPTNDYVKVQIRYCATCNKCQVQKIKQPWNVFFNQPFTKE